MFAVFLFVVIFAIECCLIYNPNKKEDAETITSEPIVAEEIKTSEDDFAQVQVRSDNFYIEIEALTTDVWDEAASPAPQTVIEVDEPLPQKKPRSRKASNVTTPRNKGKAATKTRKKATGKLAS